MSPSRTVVINEVYARPPNRNDPLRFVELRNLSPAAVDLSGWRLVGDAVFEFPDNVSLPAEGFAVVAEDPRALRRLKGDSLDGCVLLGPLHQSLSGENDYMRLLNRQGAEVDVWSITSFPPWPMEIVGQGASLERISGQAGSLDPSNWRASEVLDGGTPGQPNSVADDAPPPFVWSVTLTPEHPAPLQPVHVEAVIAGLPSATSASLVLWTDHSPERTLPLAVEKNDSQNPLSMLGDRPLCRWSATVPGLTTGTVALLTIDACDRLNGTCRPWPDEPEWHSEGFVAGDFTTTSTLPQYRLAVADSRWRLLMDNPHVHGLDVPAGVFVGNRFYPHTWLRLRGRSSRGYPKKSFRLTLTHGLRLPDGRDKVYLKCEWTDPSLIRERLAFSVDDCLELPTFQVIPSLLWVNGRFYGVMSDVELPSRHWLKRVGLDPDGKFVRVDFGLYPIAGLPSIRDKDFSAVGNKEAGAEAYDRMAFRLADIPPERAAPAVERIFDTRRLIQWALGRALENDLDAYFINRGYYRFPDPPIDQPGRWMVVPWDLDLTFGRYMKPFGWFRNPNLQIETPILDWRRQGDVLVDAISLSLDLRDRFFRRLEWAVGACFQDDTLLPRIRKWTEEIGEWGARDRKQWERGGVPGTWKEQPALLAEYINRRRDVLLAWQRPQFYRGGMTRPEDIVSPPQEEVRDLESLWRNLSPDWKRVFPVAAKLGGGYWPSLPLWAEIAVAARQAIGRTLPPTHFLESPPAIGSSASEFHSARTFLLLAFAVLLVWAAGFPSSGRRKRDANAGNQLNDESIQWKGIRTNALRGFLVGLFLVILGYALSTSLPDGFPRPLAKDWWNQPTGLAVWIAALAFCGPSPTRRSWIRWPLAFALGAFYFLGAFSPVPVSVLEPGTPWLVAFGVGVGVYLFLRGRREENPNRQRLGMTVFFLAIVVSKIWAGSSRPEFLKIPAEVWAAAAGIVFALPGKASPPVRGLRAALAALVAWHLVGEHAAVFLALWDHGSSAKESLKGLNMPAGLELRLGLPALATSVLVLVPALLWRMGGGSSPTRAKKFILRILSVACLVGIAFWLRAPGRAGATPPEKQDFSTVANEQTFERSIREAALGKAQGNLRPLDTSFTTWLDYPKSLREVPSRRPLLAAEILGSTGSPNAMRYAHVLLIHRNPWMLGEALAAHFAMGTPLAPQDARWLRKRLDEGKLDLDLPHGGRFKGGLTQRLLDEIQAVTGNAAINSSE